MPRVTSVRYVFLMIRSAFRGGPRRIGLESDPVAAQRRVVSISCLRHGHDLTIPNDEVGADDHADVVDLRLGMFGRKHFVDRVGRDHSDAAVDFVQQAIGESVLGSFRSL